jgi:hypothetical protein
MSRLATVLPPERLRLRRAPNTESEVIAMLKPGAQVTITAATGDWRRVETSAFGPGFVHAGFITVDGTNPVLNDPPGTDPAIPDEELARNDDRTGTRTSTPAFYTVQPDDVLSVIGQRLGVRWQDIAEANDIDPPFVIRPNQVLRIPGAAVSTTTGTATGGAPAIATIEVRNPLAFDGVTRVTSSSAQGHHTPYGGTHSCDLDIDFAVSSPGTPVHFNVVAPAGREVRGVVHIIGFACRSHILSEGGHKVQIFLQQRTAGGDWQDTGAWVVYAHLDPVAVAVDQVVTPGAKIGSLGPTGGGEYNSACARGSHTHVEASRGASVVTLGSKIRDDTVIRLGI